MKSQVSALLHVLQGVLTDVRVAYPALKGLDLDYERIALYCQTRGLSFFTLDLPNLDAMLLCGLEAGRLPLSGPLSKRVSRRVKVPRLFSGLWLRVFDRDACLREDVDITALFFLRQLSCLGKKYATDCSTSRINAAVKEYKDVERELRNPSNRWELDAIDFESNRDAHWLSQCCDYSATFDQGLFADLQEKEEKQETQDQQLVTRRVLDKCQRVCDLIIGAFDSYDPLEFSLRHESESLGTTFKHGPGAVAEGKRVREKSSFLYWPAKLERHFPFRLVGKTISSDAEQPLSHEVASRLICVPKTAKGPRLIAAEPTAHQYCQQSVRKYLEEQLINLFGERFICFKKQSLSGDLVLKASKDRSLATVDLSSASDRLSCWTVERVFRKNPSLLTALHAARTRFLRDDVSKEVDFLKLKKFASQGTATTFPVQSIVFLCLALGCSIQGRVSWRSIMKLSNQVRVFGDDIILPSHGYERLCLVMNALQLKVNVAKSYVHGHFRESCGTDGYMGYDVTPIKPKVLVAGSPAETQAVVDTTNNLYCKGIWNASISCQQLLPPRVQRGLRIVDVRTAGFSGLASFSGSDESHLRTRWNSRLHRNEVRVFGLRSKTSSRPREGYDAFLDFVSRLHNHEQARVVSDSICTRKVRSDFLWESSNMDARIDS